MLKARLRRRLCRRDRRGALALVLAVLLAAAPAAAETPIGQVKKVSGTVSILRGGAHLAAKPGTALYQSDTIETGAHGSLGIAFTDATVFSTGPRSLLQLQAFGFDPRSKDGNLTAELRQGTLAVVSGRITHDHPGAMKIKTPTAVLGVRGTTFAVQVAAGPPKELFVVLPNANGTPGSGAISIGNTVLDQPYFAAEMREGAAVPVTLSPADVAAIFAEALAAQPVPPGALVNALLAQFPNGGSELSAAIAQAVEADPTLAAAAVDAAATANPAQQQAIGAGLAAAAMFFASAAAGGDSDAAAAAEIQQAILAALAAASPALQAAFEAAGGFAALAPSLGGATGGGLTTNSCISPSGAGGRC